MRRPRETDSIPTGDAWQITKTMNQNKFTRSGCLTALLFLILIANLGFAVYSIITFNRARLLLPYLPAWILVVNILLCLGNAGCAVGIWFWRRWGIIGYGALTVISYLLNAIMTGNFMNIYGLVGAIILVLFIVPYWKWMK